MRQENKKASIWLSSGHFITDCYSGFLNPILPFVAANLGISMTIAALMVSASNLTASLSQPLFGFIADKWKKRFFIFWGMLFASIFLSLIGIAPNPWILALCIILGSMGVSFFHPQATSFLAFFSNEKNSNQQMGLYIALGTIGYALGPVVSSTIAERWGLHSLPYASVLGVLMAISMFFFVPKVSLLNLKKPDTSLIKAFKDMFKNSTMRILFFASVMKSLIASSFCLILPFYWKSIGFTVSKIGFIIFVFMLFGAFGTYLSPIIEKKINAKKVFYISLLLVFPLTLIFCKFQSLPMHISILAFLLTGFVSFLSVPLNMIMAQKTMPQYKSMIAGFIGGFSWGIVGLLLPLISFFAQKFGILNILLILSIFPMLFAYFIKYLPENA